ncbi:MAG: hypothetical protein ACLQVL_11335 [Terriglobia bacterium]
MNPVIESLRRELLFLAKGNITWEGDTRRCEYIRPIREYFQYSQWPNYEDFLADPLNLGFREKFEEHDRALAAVESSAGEFADGLMHSDPFQAKVKNSLEQYQSIARTDPQYPYLDDSPKGSLARGMAALLVNGIEVLPHHYGTHKFWEVHKYEFEPYRDSPSFQTVKKTTGALKEVSGKLLLELENHRQSLCRTYDIPAAPISAEKSRSTDAFNF